MARQLRLVRFTVLGAVLGVTALVVAAEAVRSAAPAKAAKAAVPRVTLQKAQTATQQPARALVPAAASSLQVPAKLSTAKLREALAPALKMTEKEVPAPVPAPALSKPGDVITFSPTSVPSGAYLVVDHPTLTIAMPSSPALAIAEGWVTPTESHPGTVTLGVPIPGGGAYVAICYMDVGQPTLPYRVQESLTNGDQLTTGLLTAAVQDDTVMIAYQTKPEAHSLWIQLGATQGDVPAGSLRWNFVWLSCDVMRIR
jgi:hypothetical protein